MSISAKQLDLYLYNHCSNTKDKKLILTCAEIYEKLEHCQNDDITDIRSHIDNMNTAVKGLNIDQKEKDIICKKLQSQCRNNYYNNYNYRHI